MLRSSHALGWASLFGASVALLACSPTSLCGCSSPLPTRLVEGAVRTSADVPIPGAQVHSATLLPDCSDPPYTDRSEATAGPAGNYSLTVVSQIGPDVCVRLMAVRTDRTPWDSVTVDRMLRVEVAEQPPVMVDLIFPDQP